MLSETEMIREYKRTNLFIIDEKLWAWAKYRAETLRYPSVSEYLFDLIQHDKVHKVFKEKGVE